MLTESGSSGDGNECSNSGRILDVMLIGIAADLIQGVRKGRKMTTTLPVWVKGYELAKMGKVCVCVCVYEIERERAYMRMLEGSPHPFIFPLLHSSM